jgi:hypothetical protein
VPPPAQGFRLLTPNMKLVDLGTEFGVQVDSAAQKAEVHVFEGEVEAHPDSGPMVKLRQGMGLGSGLVFTDDNNILPLVNFGVAKNACNASMRSIIGTKVFKFWLNIKGLLSLDLMHTPTSRGF